jgi:peptidoglycan/LPS O-acetylase OafA/YrhL
MTLSNLNKQEPPKFGFSFAWKKIRPLYPLHIVTMLLIAIYFVHIGTGIVKTVFNMGIHSLLIQMWIPNTVYYTTLNGPAWYLCASFFLYLCFPLIFGFIKKHLDKRRAYIAIFLTAVLQIGVAVFAYFCTAPSRVEWFNTHWFVYYFPPTRLIDFAIGCFMGYLYFSKQSGSSRSENSPKASAVVIELSACIATVLTWLIFTHDFGVLGSEPVKYSLLFMPVNALVIWTAASGEGVLHRILAFKPFVKLGDLSPYTFLIHMVFIRYCPLFFNLLGQKNPTVISVTAFLLTIAAAIVWKHLWNNLKQG